MIVLGYAGACAGFAFQLERGLEEIDVASRRLIQLRQHFSRLPPDQALIADQTAHHGTVFLLHPGWVVFAIGPRAGKVQFGVFAVINVSGVDEYAVVVGIQAAPCKRQPRAGHSQRLDDPRWVTKQERQALRPARGNIGQGQAMHHATAHHAAIVLDSVHRHEPRARVAPVGEGADRHPAADRRAQPPAPWAGARRRRPCVAAVRSGLNNRSMLAALIMSIRRRTSVSSRQWPCRSRASIRSGSDALSRLLQIRSAASHSITSAWRTASS
jgi:hypothetical protein